MDNKDIIITQTKTQRIIIALWRLAWLIAGSMLFYPLATATPQSQWAFGFFFGLGFLACMDYVIKTPIMFVYNHSTKLREFADKHFGDEE